MSKKKESLKPTLSTRQHVLAASGNCCAFPSCNEMIFDLEHESLVGDIAHIKGEKPTSARYDTKQTEEQRRHFSNLLALCKKHHKIVDDREDKYPTKTLIDMKQSHEEKIANTGDRGWLMPPNSIHKWNLDGEPTSIYYWLDRNGKPQIYTDRQRAMADTLMELNLNMNKIGGILAALEEQRDHHEFANTFLQQSWGHLEHGEWTPYAHIIRLMAMTPDVTFGEFIRFIVQGGDATGLLVEMAG